MAQWDYTTPEGQQTDKLEITKLTIEGFDTATPTAVVEYDEFETDGTTFIRSRRVSITDGAALRVLLDAAVVSGNTADNLAEDLFTQMLAEGTISAGAFVP